MSGTSAAASHIDAVNTAAESKRAYTLQAHAALNGIALDRLADGTFIAMKWGLRKELPSLCEAEQWLSVVTGERP